MTPDQAFRLAAFVLTIRPEWSRTTLMRLLQSHTHGTEGREKMGVDELSTYMLAAAFDPAKGHSFRRELTFEQIAAGSASMDLT
jgi:hypothetical protein